MKLNRKWILVASLLLSVVMATSGTLAYMTATASKTNTFTVGNVAITLDEPSWEDKSLIGPGVTVAKDPTITNTGRTAAYVWLTVDVPNSVYDYISFDTLGAGWTNAGATTGEDVTTVVFKYNNNEDNKLASNATTTAAFSSVTLAKDIPEEVFDALAATFEMVVKAYAIEATFDSFDDAYNAYGSETGDGPVEDKTATDAESLTEALQGNSNIDLANSEISGESFSTTSNVAIANGSINATTPGYGYGYLIREGGSTTFENVNITTQGGGLNIIEGSAVFKSGSITTNSLSTSGRHVFYVANGSLTIESGEFKFSPTNLTRKGSYIYADNSDVIVNGGTFHMPSERDGHDPIKTANGGTVTIYGGRFAFDPSAFVAEGYQAVESDGWWTVSKL